LLLKKHIKAGHPGIVDHSIKFIKINQKYIKRHGQKQYLFYPLFYRRPFHQVYQNMDRNNIYFILYKCITANPSATWKQTAHTTYQITSPSCLTRAMQKSQTLNKKCLSFMENSWVNRWVNRLSAEK